MKEQELIRISVNKLQKYIEENNYRGYDPYDALLSPFFKLPFLKSNKLIRFGTQQLIKRLPVNFRPALLVPKGLNPVTLGLCLQGYANQLASKTADEKTLLTKCENIITQLENFIPQGFHGACWGYDFDWEARYANIPAYQPTIVATGIITNALFKYYQITKSEKALKLCISACDFVLNDINRSVGENGDFCLSYSPFDNQKVFNANMKGVRLLAQVFSITKDNSLKDAAYNATAYLIRNQQENGSWFYSNQEKGKWVDNYHTGYVLDCLDEFINYTGHQEFSENLKNGFLYYKNNFFEKGYIPKFYDNKIFPVDCTSGGQSLLTLIRFGELDQALKVSIYLINQMQAPEGYFYFRKYKNYTEKTSFMRWSNAWMFAGLTELLKKLIADRNY